MSPLGVGMLGYGSLALRGVLPHLSEADARAGVVVKIIEKAHLAAQTGVAQDVCSDPSPIR
jgi:hypothetical protein